MKVGGSPPLKGGSGVSGRTVSRAGGADTVVAGVRAVADTTSVMGIPEAELTTRVRQAIMSLMGEVDSLRRDLEHAHRRLADLERLADQDTLVPLPNRRAFVRELSRILSYGQRYDVPAALLYFDLNNFKEINDQYGHAAGDAALHRVAQTLADNIRGSDVVGRIGGDEFAVILIQVEEPRAIEKAGTLADAIQGSPLIWQGQSIAISVAYGVTMLHGSADPGEALAAADRAMYSHKRSQKQKS